MELYKNKENHKNPVKTARANYNALAFIYTLFSILFFNTQPQLAYYLFPSAILLVIISYLLSKGKIIGIYLGWLFILLGTLATIIKGAWISLIILAYLAYWNHKAQEVMKSNLTTPVYDKTAKP